MSECIGVAKRGRPAPLTAEQMGLVLAHEARARKVARSAMVKMTSLRKAEREDVEQEALAALVVAARAYRPETGVPFWAYAKRPIGWAMAEAATKAEAIRQPKHLLRDPARTGQGHNQAAYFRLRRYVGYELAAVAARPSAESIEDRRAIPAVVTEALASMSDQARETVMRFFGQGETLRTIAASQGRTYQAVQQQASKAIKRVRKYLRERGVTCLQSAWATS